MPDSDRAMRADGLLAGGRRLLVRPLWPSDRSALAAAFERLSDDSRYRRFLGPKPTLSEAELTYLTELDQRLRAALVAVDPADGRIVGVARYAASSLESADCAVAVADECRRLGIGRELVSRLVGVARTNGVRRLEATTLWDNRAARGLLRGLGFHAAGADGHVLAFELPL